MASSDRSIDPKMSVKSLSKGHSFPTLLNARILAMFAVSVLNGSFANIPNTLYGLCAIAFIELGSIVKTAYLHRTPRVNL